jgi:uncharacterized membrane protein (UPF0127 family)
MNTIAKEPLNLIKNFLAFSFILITFMSCNENDKSALAHKQYEQGEIELPSGKILTVYLAKSYAEQKRGLSHLKPEQFSTNEAMLFLDDFEHPRQFWMPNTHFNLDIIYLSKDLYVLDIHRNLQHFPKEGPNHLVPRSKTVVCRHVLEIRSESSLASEIHPGMILKWNSSPHLLQTK